MNIVLKLDTDRPLNLLVFGALYRNVKVSASLNLPCIPFRTVLIDIKQFY